MSLLCAIPRRASWSTSAFYRRPFFYQAPESIRMPIWLSVNPTIIPISHTIYSNSKLDTILNQCAPVAVLSSSWATLESLNAIIYPAIRGTCRRALICLTRAIEELKWNSEGIDASVTLVLEVWRLDRETCLFFHWKNPNYPQKYQEAV